jgi:hypothetical protein
MVVVQREPLIAVRPTFSGNDQVLTAQQHVGFESPNPTLARAD